MNFAELNIGLNNDFVKISYLGSKYFFALYAHYDNVQELFEVCTYLLMYLQYNSTCLFTSVLYFVCLISVSFSAYAYSHLF